MIKSIYVNNGICQQEESIENINKIYSNNPSLLWVDITLEKGDLSTDEIALLTDTFKFHELSVEDCLFPLYNPKVEEFDNYLFVNTHGIRLKTMDLAEFDEYMYELDIFLSSNLIVTAHTEELEFLDTLMHKAMLKPQVELKSMETLLYKILSKVIDNLEHTMEKISDKIDLLEDKVLEDPHPDVMEQILDLKKVLLSMRKIADPQKNVYSFFSRENNEYIRDSYSAYFRDITDQLNSLNKTINYNSQMISSLIAIYMSSVTLKLNETMKFLSIIATIFLPVLIVASYYGMNVAFPEINLLGQTGTWFLAIFLILAATFGIILYMKSKKWF
ncbi:MAG: magnesium transporter CorA family protein [Elusimicrobia bacterium]|jgi:magnesium transporter|nr:magnesium transporter CorA family protein [Elusimicrobiota bacterium]